MKLELKAAVSKLAEAIVANKGNRGREAEWRAFAQRAISRLDYDEWMAVKHSNNAVFQRMLERAVERGSTRDGCLHERTT